MVWYHDPHWWHITLPCFHLKPLQAGHLVVGPRLVSMPPESRRRGRKAEKTALGVLSVGGGIECWWRWCGFDRPVRQSRHVPIGALRFSSLNAGETGMVGAVSQEAPLPLVTTTETAAPGNFRPLSSPPREGGSVDGWREDFGLRRISIIRHIASSNFQEASPRKFNVQTNKVDGEVN